MSLIESETRRSPPPIWALQRVATVLERSPDLAQGRNAKHIAQKTGISKSLARSCIIYLATRQ